MNDAEEAEMMELCDTLHAILDDGSLSSTARTSLKKAIIVVSLVYINDLAGDLERNFRSLGTALTEEERDQAISKGIDPDDLTRYT